MNVVKVKTLVTSKIQIATARSDSSVTVFNSIGGYAEETTGLCATTHRLVFVKLQQEASYYIFSG